MIAAILGVVAAVCGQARADDALDVFRTTTEHYRAAPERAVQALTRADLDMVVRGAAACGASLSRTGAPSVCSRRDALAGAMMLSDAADVAFGIEAGLGRSLLRAATRLIDRLERRIGRTEMEAVFIPRFYAHAGRQLLVQRLVPDAARLVGNSLDGFPESDDLRIAMVLIAEVQNYWTNDNVRGDTTSSSPLLNRIPIRWGGPQLNRAAEEYERVLRRHPQNVEARIHLAWLHVLIRDKRADGDLDLAIRDAANGDERYLAHLLRAGIAERADRLDDAIDEYGRAADAGPYYKSACTGLSRAYVMAGRSGEAADTATRCMRLSLERDQNDPWLTLRFGVTPAPMVEWLRAEARR